jgi:hypothetical protein
MTRLGQWRKVGPVLDHGNMREYGGRNGDEGGGGKPKCRVPCGGRYTFFGLALDPNNIIRSACVG